MPPSAAEQVQLQGPLPDTEEGIPIEQRLDVGAVKEAWLPAEPQVAFTEPLLFASGALQEEVVPPFEPEQVHVQGPLPDTVVGVPIVQRLFTGAVKEAWLPAEPQVAFTGAELAELGL
jgi:hypothetical protein